MTADGAGGQGLQDRPPYLRGARDGTTRLPERTEVRRPRRRLRAAGWVPVQHGAWFMLASPLLVGAVAAGPSWRHALLGAAWFAGYFAFSATSQWLKSRRRTRYWPPVRAYVPLAAVLAALAVVSSPVVLWWAPVFAALLAASLLAAATGHERDTLAGIGTVVLSSLMTLVAYQVGGGDDARRAALLAAVQFLYFAGTVLYVKSMIRARGNARAHAGSVLASAAATLAVLAFSPPLAVVFGLLTVRALVVPRFPLRPAQVGAGEVLATVAVAIVSLATV